jgi:hypothetical protein
MKRRNFLGACLAAIAAPLAAVAQPAKPKDPRIFYATEKIKFGEKSKESPVVGDESVGFTYTHQMDNDEWIGKIKRAMVKSRSALVTYDKPNRNCDIYMSPKTLEDIKAWGVDEIDEETQREIMTNFSDDFYFGGLGVSAIHSCEGLSKEEIFELGHHRPYYRYVDYPVEITEEIKVDV